MENINAIIKKINQEHPEFKAKVTTTSWIDPNTNENIVYYRLILDGEYWCSRKTIKEMEDYLIAWSSSGFPIMITQEEMEQALNDDFNLDPLI